VTRLRAGRPAFDFREGQGFFPLRHRIQTGYGAHPAFYAMGIGDSFPGGKAVGA